MKFERLPDASHLAGAALFRSPKGNSWKTFYEFPLPARRGAVRRRASPDAGPPLADPRVAYFMDSIKIDNGVEFDESMFPNASAARRPSLPVKVAAPEAPARPGKRSPWRAQVVLPAEVHRDVTAPPSATTKGLMRGASVGAPAAPDPLSRRRARHIW